MLEVERRRIRRERKIGWTIAYCAQLLCVSDHASACEQEAGGAASEGRGGIGNKGISGWNYKVLTGHTTVQTDGVCGRM